MKESILSTQAIVVFGGLSGWGEKIAESCRDVSRAVTIISEESIKEETQAAVTQADTVFLAAPDTEIRKILLDNRQLFQAKNLLDCATNKGGFADLLKEIGEECSTCSTHPMVRSETPSRGQNVLLMPVGDRSSQAQTIAGEIFNRLGMNIREFEFEKHGELMTVLQFIPHMIQRVLIGSLGRILNEKHLTLGDVGQFAPANFLVTELGIGRVGIQRPSVSAGIIVEALKTEFGRHVLDVIKDAVAVFEQTAERDDLEQQFATEIQQLDRDNSWKKRMEEKTDVMIEAMGNLKARSFQLLSDRDEPGLLRDICTILAQRNINMTAMHSHLIENDEGRKSVRFDIGINDTEVDWQSLQEEFDSLGLRLKRENA